MLNRQVKKSHWTNAQTNNNGLRSKEIIELPLTEKRSLKTRQQEKIKRKKWKGAPSVTSMSTN